MEDNKKKRLKKEFILTSIVIVELVIVYVCIVAVKVNTDKKSQTNFYCDNNIQRPDAIEKTTSSPSDNTKATLKPKPGVTTNPTDNTTKPNNTTLPKNSTVPEKSSIPKATKKPSSSNKGTNNDQLNDIKKILFKDSVFLGDSRTEGLQIKTGLSSAKFITHRGLTVSTAMTEKVIKLKNGEKGTILDALKEGTYSKVFVMFGINELGWPYTSTFKSQYVKFIKKIKEIQPNAEIYVQSIIPVTKTKSDNTKIYTLKHVKEFNKVIKAMAKSQNVHYLNVQEAVIKTDDYLPEDYATDGVHLTKQACFEWLKYITNKIS